MFRYLDSFDETFKEEVNKIVREYFFLCDNVAIKIVKKTFSVQSANFGKCEDFFLLGLSVSVNVIYFTLTHSLSLVITSELDCIVCELLPYVPPFPEFLFPAFHQIAIRTAANNILCSLLVLSCTHVLNRFGDSAVRRGVY